MKAAKDWKKETDKVLTEKAKELIKTYDGERQGLFEELASLSETLEKFENQEKEIIATQEKEAKEFIPNSKILNECGLKMGHVNKIIRETQKQIDALFLKLTKLPDFVKDVFPFIKLLG